MGKLRKFGSHGDQIPQMETKFPKWGPTSISANISEYQVQTKFQMFTITSDVPCDMPILAAGEVCCSKPRCVVTGASAANTCTCWPSSWPASASQAATASTSTARDAAAAPVWYAPACASSTKLGTSYTPAGSF